MSELCDACGHAPRHLDRVCCISHPYETTYNCNINDPCELCIDRQRIRREAREAALREAAAIVWDADQRGEVVRDVILALIDEEPH